MYFFKHNPKIYEIVITYFVAPKVIKYNLSLVHKGADKPKRTLAIRIGSAMAFPFFDVFSKYHSLIEISQLFRIIIL